MIQSAFPSMLKAQSDLKIFKFKHLYYVRQPCIGTLTVEIGPIFRRCCNHTSNTTRIVHSSELCNESWMFFLSFLFLEKIPIDVGIDKSPGSSAM